ncbi:choice-of-anchor Q domain-containing protein [Streptomyces sp. NPDC057137]|uniref:choice-of-anchor Q domain-containing protein n=1 Tax=Streptomyces sp. NPDC057137 TaxID=3346030 RepID=UPI00362EF7E6
MHLRDHAPRRVRDHTPRRIRHLRTAAAGLVGTVLATLAATNPAHAVPTSAPTAVVRAAAVPPSTTGARLQTSGNPTPVGNGTVRYLDSQAGDDSAAGTTPATAWKTLNRVTAASPAPGDVVALRRGQTFTGSATLGGSGTASAPITVTAFGTGAPPTLSNPGGWNMLQLAGSHIEVTQLRFADGAVFDNADGQGITGPKYRLSGAIAVTGPAGSAHIHDNEFTQVGVGVKTYALGTRIDHNSFHDLKIAFRGMDAGAETSYGALGVSINNSDAQVSFNRFVNCRSTDSPYGADGGAVEIEGFDHAKNDITIDHNYSSGSQGFLEVTETTTSNVSLLYNISDDYQQFVAFDTTTQPSGYRVDHNTVVRARGDNQTQFAIYFYREPGPDPTDSWLSLTNNIFYLTSGVVLHDYDWPHDHNLVLGTLGYAPGPGDIQADPQFTDTAGGDYRPGPTSPARDNGTAATAATDIYGNNSTVGPGSDIGAVEAQNAPAAGADAVADGGFEQQTAITATSSPWVADGSPQSGVDVAQGTAHTGQDNAWITSTDQTGWGAVKQNVPVVAGATYRLTAWVKNSGNIDHGWLGAKTAQGTVINEISHGGSPDWTRFVLTVKPGTATQLSLYVGYYGPVGQSAWERIDDVTLRRIS